MSVQGGKNPELGEIGKKVMRSKKKDSTARKERTDSTAVENEELEYMKHHLMENESSVYLTKCLSGRETEEIALNKVGKTCEKEDLNNTENREGRDRTNKKIKKRTGEGEEDYKNVKGKKHTTDGEDIEHLLTNNDGVASEGIKRKKRKSKQMTDKDYNTIRGKNSMLTNIKKGKSEKTKSVENDPRNPNPEETKKKVRCSGHVEAFPSSDVINSGNEEHRKDVLIRGKRFSIEDDILKAAISNYIESNCLGDKGYYMVMNSRSHRKIIGNCWKEIAAALPHRPYKSVYFRALMLDRNRGKWTEEDIENLRKYQKKHGNNWKAVAKELDRNRYHASVKWRSIKEKRNKGHWSQEEYQNLFDLVNVDLRMKAFEEKKSKHGMLRDNIAWCAISDRLSTRSDATCCSKWYNQLTSSLVAEGKWADSDDHRLLNALFYLDACCIEDVQWDNLIDQRSADVCRRRWDQMVLHIGSHRNKSFAEQVEVLAKRYCPELLEAREAWESKPWIP